jgi:hypothetical protein
MRKITKIQKKIKIILINVVLISAEIFTILILIKNKYQQVKWRS